MIENSSLERDSRLSNKGAHLNNIKTRSKLMPNCNKTSNCSTFIIKHQMTLIILSLAFLVSFECAEGFRRRDDQNEMPLSKFNQFIDLFKEQNSLGKLITNKMLQKHQKQKTNSKYKQKIVEKFINHQMPSCFRRSKQLDRADPSLLVESNIIDPRTSANQAVEPRPLNEPELMRHLLTMARFSDTKFARLPNGPPPFIPPKFMLYNPRSKLSLPFLLAKLKHTKMFKRMYKSKVYYLFLDTLQQLTLMANRISRTKTSLTSANVAFIEAAVNKFALKSGHSLKLKWPLVLLNPRFIKEIISNPTFLVMLFHAIEVAYMSMPSKIWLKPLVRLVKQPGPEKEEQIWWRRKRFYDTLNGHGTSELQPNIKTVHFRNPGKKTPIAIPRLVNFARTLTGRPAPNPSHFSYSQIINQIPQESHTLVASDTKNNAALVQQESLRSISPDLPFDQEALNVNNPNYDQQRPLDLFIIDYGSPIEAHQYHNNELNQSMSNQNWLTELPSQEQLMTQAEFDSLDDDYKRKVLEEARRSLEESVSTNELIKQHDNLIESITRHNKEF